VFTNRLDGRARTGLRNTVFNFEQYVTGISTELDGNRATLSLPDQYDLDRIDLFIDIDTKLYVVRRSYDMNVRARVPTTEAPSGPEAYELSYSGRIRPTGASFESADPRDEPSELLNRLNEQESILEDAVDLDFLDFTVTYRKEENEWEILGSLHAGSSVWIMVPPLFYSVDCTEDHCRKILRVFDGVCRTIER
jgi:hypothetical protein